MTDAVDARREFVQWLQDRPFVEDVDYTRDGFKTVVLELGEVDAPAELDECVICGAVGLEERIREHDCESFREWRAGQ